MAAGDVEVAITTPNARAGASFDGVDDKVTKENFLNVKSTDSFTFGCWAKPQGAFANDKVMFNTQSTTGDATRGIAIEGVASGEVRIIFFDLTKLVESTAVLSGDVWHHIMGTYTASTREIRLYIDGVYDTSVTGDTDFNEDNLDLRIGSLQAGFGFFHGCISDVMIFRCCLSDVEVASVANNDTTITRCLIHHWPLQDNYLDVVGSADGTNSGSRLGIFEEDLAASIKAARVSANDKFLLVDTGFGKQVLTGVIEEAP